MIENENIISKDDQLANTFNNFFSNAVKQLDVQIPSALTSDTNQLINPIKKAVNKFKNHTSILKMKEEYGQDDTFSFKYILLTEMTNEIIGLNNSKAIPKETIPVKIIKENIDIFSSILHNNFNNNIYSGLFPQNLKLADVSPLYKMKGDKHQKSNYRPVSILHAISKVYERLLFHQLNEYFETKLSKYQCGYRKGYSAQHCLILMLEKWKYSIDKNGASGALLTDMSKAFDCLSHELLIAKLEAYGFDFNSLEIIYDYLTNRKQRVRINSKYSSWSQIISGVPQGSIIGPLLFNIYLADLFIFSKDSYIANFADDNTPYACDQNIESVIKRLENDSIQLFQWFENNGLKANSGKSHLILSSKSIDISAEINGKTINNENDVYLLGITLDNDLNFTKHVSNLCKKASQKLHALSRVSGLMSINQRRILMKSFIQSQFGYSPLVWMFHSRELNNRINRIHERSLRVVYRDNVSSFGELLEKDNSFTIHERNIQSLAIELYKAVNHLSPEFMNEILPLKRDLSHCSKQDFITKNVRTVHNGTETLSYLGPKIWLLIPNEIKELKSLNKFKQKIKKWKPNKCPCRLCKVYVSGVGFIGSVG